MNKDAKIFVAGHRGLVGSAILKNLRQKGYSNFVLRTHRELDLTDQAAVRAFFEAERPEYVFLEAGIGRVGCRRTIAIDGIAVGRHEKGQDAQQAEQE